MAQGCVLEADRQSVTHDPFEAKDTCKVMLAVPSSGYVDSIIYDNHLDFVVECMRLESRSNFKFFTGNTHRLHVSYARELICAEAIKQGLDYLLMVDDDQILPRNTFERLFKSMQANKAHIAAPMVTQRLHPFLPVMYRTKVTELDTLDAKGNRAKKFENTNVTEYEPNSVQTLDAVGFGVVLIDLAMVKKMKAPLFFSNTNIGEDIYFCWKAAQEAGAKIICDTAIKVGHLKHPEMATEWDFVKSHKLQDKFAGVYGHIEARERVDIGGIEKLNEKS